ncbi:kinase-associated lipoprotein B [Metabacillus sp. KIGAM252]|uniref:Kinase-associated lipoprotein B n=1 Tax=Metabacillus flavus TaxID=2823519 RepID=A0ABS5LI65_9BACI|nr:kinase-associated lipoprotein B [Metabacillus flavus]MBS2970311.1 kinase-associated lipoprotein B [Metabacillus flavus]
MEFQPGDYVTGIYKTGKYAGVVTAIRPMHILVQVKAVLKHPQQGDLHMPKEAEVPLFHERRALSFNEQTNVPKNMVKPLDGDIPDYKKSLRESIDQMRSSLNNDDSLWAKRSMACLDQLEKDYNL